MPAPSLGLQGAYGAASVEGALRQLLADQKAAQLKAEQDAYKREQDRLENEREGRRVSVDEGQLQLQRDALAAKPAPTTKRSISMLKGLKGPQGPVTRGVDEETGEITYEFPEHETPAKPGATTDYGDFLLRFAKSKGITDPQDITTDIEVAARKAWGQADDQPFRGFPPIVIAGQGPSGEPGFFQVNRGGTPTAKPVTLDEGGAAGAGGQGGGGGRAAGPGPGGAGGPQLQQPPTAQQRDRVAARKTSAPVLAAISELSERINTGQGIVAKATGTAARLAAKANLDDDVSEYEAVISGFVPVLARAVGHVGVLTQQDVDSVRNMLPKPSDSKSVRDRKVARIESLMAGIAGDAPPANAPRSRGAGGSRLVYDPATGTFKRSGG